MRLHIHDIMNHDKTKLTFSFYKVLEHVINEVLDFYAIIFSLYFEQTVIPNASFTRETH